MRLFYSCIVQLHLYNRTVIIRMRNVSEYMLTPVLSISRTRLIVFYGDA